MTLDTIVNIPGNLKDAYKLAVPKTLRYVDELTTERRTNADLRSQSFYTADGNVYFSDKDIPTLYITREATNPILKNIDDAFTQLTTNHNYTVLQSDFDAVKKAEDTVTIDLTKLTLQGDDKEWGYLAISTTKYNKLNIEERKLAERVYGPGNDFVENMKMLSDARINETKIFVLNPGYVKTNAKDNPVGRASWLYIFYYNSIFDAIDRNFSDYSRVRGVRREVVRPQGDAAKNEAVPQDAVVPSEVKAPSMDDILRYVTPFVAEVNKSQFEAGLRKLYKP